MDELESLNKDTSNQLRNIRGKGLLVAFDYELKKKNLDLHKALRDKGLNTGTLNLINFSKIG